MLPVRLGRGFEIGIIDFEVGWGLPFRL